MISDILNRLFGKQHNSAQGRGAKEPFSTQNSTTVPGIFAPFDGSDTYDYPKRLMLHYAPNFFYRAQNNFQEFWKYRYNVNPQAVLDTLECEGWIMEGSLITAVHQLTVEQLKTLLSSQSLPQKGKKQDLINRVLEEIPHNVIQQFCPVLNYQLTDTGEKILNEKLTQDVLYVHNHPDDHVNPYEIGERNILDFILDKLKQDCSKYASKGNWGLYRNAINRMSEICDEKGDHEASLGLFLEVCLWDYSGLDNSWTKDDVDTGKLLEYDSINAILYKMKKHNISIDKLSKLCDTHINNDLIPINVSTKKLKSFIMDEVLNDLQKG